MESTFKLVARSWIIETVDNSLAGRPVSNIRMLQRESVGADLSAVKQDSEFNNPEMMDKRGLYCQT